MTEIDTIAAEVGARLNMTPRSIRHLAAVLPALVDDDGRDWLREPVLVPEGPAPARAGKCPGCGMTYCIGAACPSRQ